MKKYNISDRYKEQICNVVLKLPKKTDLQKERFIRYYGLQPTELKKRNIIFNCKRTTLYSKCCKKFSYFYKNCYVSYSWWNFSILEKIYEEYHM